MMMKLRITYWEQSGRLITREIEAVDEDAAIAMLVADDQHPLAQEDYIEILEVTL